MREPAAMPLRPGVLWSRQAEGAEIRFVGTGAPEGTRDLLAREHSPRPALAWLKQIHSATVHSAVAGLGGEGDALWTQKKNLALCIYTADCLPVLLAGRETVAAAHAGWRGVVGGILPNTVRALPEDPRTLSAWIGPAIGPCCFEVGDEVALEIAQATDPSVILPGKKDRPHVDLWRGAEIQLRELGVSRIETLRLCTFCQASRLHSYRRQGPGQGRNRALIWRTAEEAP
jgi:YfiH family protein